MLEDFKKDLESIVKAIEQSLANHNVLLGQKQAIEHVIAKIEADVPTISKEAEVAFVPIIEHAAEEVIENVA